MNRISIDYWIKNLSLQNNHLNNKIMARTINYQKKANKIKEQIDEFVKLVTEQPAEEPVEQKISISDIDLEALSPNELFKLQTRINKILAQKIKQE